MERNLDFLIPNLSIFYNFTVGDYYSANPDSDSDFSCPLPIFDFCAILKEMETMEEQVQIPKKIEDRRRFPRFDCSLRVNYTTTDNIASIGSYTQARNISKGGLRLLVSRLVKKGSILKLKIFHDDTEKAIEVLGKVRWVCEELAESNLIVDAGVQFTSIKPSEVDELLASVQ